jgi:hypothetical protein
LIYKERLNYSKAKQSCESKGMKLAIPFSDANNDYIWKKMKEKGCSRMILGLHDINKEGNWNYINNYRKWNPGEPNN